MIRIVRYSTSAAAAALLLIAGAWWMLFSHGVEKSWAAVIDQLATIRTATCNVRMHRGGFDEVSKVYLEGARVRLEILRQDWDHGFSDRKRCLRLSHHRRRP